MVTVIVLLDRFYAKFDISPKYSQGDTAGITDVACILFHNYFQKLNFVIS